MAVAVPTNRGTRWVPNRTLLWCRHRWFKGYLCKGIRLRIISSRQWMGFFWTISRPGWNLTCPGCPLSFSYSRQTSYLKCYRTEWKCSSRHHRVQVATIWMWAVPRSINCHLAEAMRSKWETLYRLKGCPQWPLLSIHCFNLSHRGVEMTTLRSWSECVPLLPASNGRIASSEVLWVSPLTTSLAPSWNT
jgi:hypothetical protein